MPTRLPIDLTTPPGEKSARRAAIAVRSHHPEWPQYNLEMCIEYLVRNPWVVDQLGPNITANVSQSKNKKVLMFTLMRDDG